MRTVSVRIASYVEDMHPELFTYILKDLMNQHLDARQGTTPGSSRVRKPRPSRWR
jgi:hypothetical protein